MRRSAALVPVLLLLATGLRAQESTPPKAWLVTPFTGYPDVLGASVALPLGGRWSVEPGATLMLPGAFARVGYHLPIGCTEVREVSLALLGGGRAAVLPVPHGGVLAGPTLELGVMSFPRTDSELVMYLSVGVWSVHSWGFCDVDCSDWDHDGMMPSIRLAFGTPLDRTR